MKPRISRKKWPPLALTSDMIAYSGCIFTHDWGSIGYNETIFPNIALEWLCDHQHNSCYYSFGSLACFSLCRGKACYYSRTWAELAASAFFPSRMWLLCPVGAIGSALIDQPDHSADLSNIWGDVQGRPSRERRQRWRGGWGFLAFVARLQVCKPSLHTMSSQEMPIK